MTIWTIKAKPVEAGEEINLDEFDDGGDPEALKAHLLAIAPGYASTDARPKVP